MDKMVRPIKVMDHLEFIKKYISESGKKYKCAFCKYNILNYKKMDEITKEHFLGVCSDCQYLKFKHVKKYYSNNFKTLYDWEEGE